MNVKEALTSLAKTPDDHRLLTQLLARGKIAGSKFTVGKRSAKFGPVGDPDAAKYAQWPESFRAFIGSIGRIQVGDSLIIGVDADGGLDGLKYLIKGTGLEKREKDVRCPVEVQPNWWVYDPSTQGASGEPVLRFLDHGGGGFSGETFEHLGSLALHLLAECLGVDEVPAAPADPKAKQAFKRFKKQGTLEETAVNSAVISGELLICAERPMNAESTARPNAVSRLAVYDLKTLALRSFLPLDAVPAKLVLDGAHALVLCVDWKKNAYRLFEVDLTDPSKPKLVEEFATIEIPPKRSMRDCEGDSALVLDGDRLLARLYFNSFDLKDLHEFKKDKGHWSLEATHEFRGVEAEQPFATVQQGKRLVASAEHLWRLFDFHWGRLVTLGDVAVVSEADPPHHFYAVDSAGKRGKPLKFSKDGHVVTLTTWNGFVVVNSSKGLDFLQPGDGCSLTLAHSIKRDLAIEVLFTGERMLIRNRKASTEVWSLG